MLHATYIFIFNKQKECIEYNRLTASHSLRHSWPLWYNANRSSCVNGKGYFAFFVARFNIELLANCPKYPTGKGVQRFPMSWERDLW